MEPMVVQTMTRSEFDKLATGWFISQIQNGVCTCDACEGVADLLSEAIEELLLFEVRWLLRWKPSKTSSTG